MINASSSGTFMWQDPEEAWQFLEQLSNGSKANFSTRKTVGTAAAVGVDADWKKEVKKEISELNKKFDRLMSTLQNGPHESIARRGPNNVTNNAPGTQEEMFAKMYEMDQQKRDSGKLPSATEVNPTHNQRPGKEQVNTVESGWRKVTLEDLFEVGSEVKLEKEEKVLGSEEGKEEETPVEKETQPEIDKEVQKEEQSTIAGIKQKKKDRKGKKK
ncbi:hypothetical protein L2E82_24702 [Cichorium intybus]|uniref:Uncharacterized protein n=1 Tax=Cichorium intybus TaxID=13427 RepID=A0ACB9E2H3_CICIN|nr:hypothetical protein L2E82_24702 [Cichorium intybus]